MKAIAQAPAFVGHVYADRWNHWGIKMSRCQNFPTRDEKSKGGI